MNCELTFVSGLDHCSVLIIQRGIKTNIKHDYLAQKNEAFGMFSKTCIWNQLAEKHSGLRATLQDKSNYKGMRRHSFRASDCILYELQNQTRDERRFWTVDSVMQRKNVSRVNSQSRVFSAIPGRTIVGPIIAIQIVKILVKE